MKTRTPLIVVLFFGIWASGVADAQELSPTLGGAPSLAEQGQPQIDTVTTCPPGEPCSCASASAMLPVDIVVDGEGVSEHLLSCIYDAEGVLLTVFADVMAENNTTIIRRTVFTYDAQGNNILEELDEGADGSVDHRLTYETNEHGARLGSLWDFGADGVVEQSCRYDPPCPPPFRECGLSCERVEEP